MNISNILYRNCDLFELQDFVNYYEKNIQQAGFLPIILVDTYLAAKKAIRDIEEASCLYAGD